MGRRMDKKRNTNVQPCSLHALYQGYPDRSQCPFYFIWSERETESFLSTHRRERVKWNYPGIQGDIRWFEIPWIRTISMDIALFYVVSRRIYHMHDRWMGSARVVAGRVRVRESYIYREKGKPDSALQSTQPPRLQWCAFGSLYTRYSFFAASRPW